MDDGSIDIQLMKQAIGYVLELESKKEYPVSEIKNRLLGRYDQNVAEKTVAYCLEHGYISDERYAQMFVRFRARNSYGAERIRYELRSRGIDDSVVSDAIDSCEVDFSDAAKEYVRRKYSDYNMKDPKIKAKVVRHMAGRGFSSEQIYRAIDSLRE